MRDALILSVLLHAACAVYEVPVATRRVLWLPIANRVGSNRTCQVDSYRLLGSISSCCKATAPASTSDDPDDDCIEMAMARWSRPLLLSRAPDSLPPAASHAATSAAGDAEAEAQPLFEVEASDGTEEADGAQLRSEPDEAEEAKPSGRGGGRLAGTKTTLDSSCGRGP